MILLGAVCPVAMIAAGQIFTLMAIRHVMPLYTLRTHLQGLEYELMVVF